MIITIDGPAGSGKSTVAELVAKKLGYHHFNSGSLYRAITSYCILNLKNNPKYDYSKLTLEVKFIKNEQHVYVNNLDMTNFLRENIVSINTPKYSMNPTIRNIIDECQKNYGSKHNIVIDGRDTGSYVFPNADYKYYLDCDIKERAKRRYKEEKAKDKTITLEEIEEQIKIRDFTDKTKAIAPLVIPKNAIMMNSSRMTAEQIAESIVSNIIIR